MNKKEKGMFIEPTPISELEIKARSLKQQLNLVELEIARQRGLFPFNKNKSNEQERESKRVS